MKWIIVMAIVVVGAAGLIFLSPRASTTPSTPALSFKTIQTSVLNGGQLIDVRTPAEYMAGHIDGAINLSLQDIQAGALPAVAKDKPVYLYCHSGSRASQAAPILKSAGYSNVINLGAMTHVQAIGGTVKS